MRKLPRVVLEALQAYYEHRKIAESVRWDKEGDLKKLDEVCGLHKIGFTAVAGTFFLWRKTVRWKVTEENFPQGGLRWIERDKGSTNWRI